MDPVLTPRPTPWLYLVPLLGLYVLPVNLALRPKLDADLWWHLRVGQWVVENRAVTENDPFSQHGEDQPWVAYSWLFEVVLYGAYSALGLTGVFLFRAVSAVLMLAACHRLLLRRESRFLVVVLLLTVAVIILARLITERPWTFTIIACALTLTSVVDLRDGRPTRSVWLLPLVYVVWANVHIQFIYGLALLGLACVAPAVEYLLGRSTTGQADTLGSPAWKRLVVVSLLCGLATLVNPYHVRLYAVVLEYASQPAPFRIVQELTAMSFRSPGDWVVLGLTLVTAFALGRRANLTSFDVLLMALAAFVAFRARRDIWMILLTALVVLPGWGQSAGQARERLTFPWSRVGALALGTGLAFVLLLRRPGFSDRVEQARRQDYPEAVVGVVKDRLARGEIEGPLYNTFGWGGYLIWHLPELKVSMDGRTNLHGDERVARYHRVLNGSAEYETDPELDRAGVVIVDASSPLTSLLRRDPRFEKLYEDEDRVAVVFVRRPRKDG